MMKIDKNKNDKHGNKAGNRDVSPETCLLTHDTMTTRVHDFPAAIVPGHRQLEQLR